MTGAIAVADPDPLGSRCGLPPLAPVCNLPVCTAEGFVFFPLPAGTACTTSEGRGVCDGGILPPPGQVEPDALGVCLIGYLGDPINGLVTAPGDTRGRALAFSGFVGKANDAVSLQVLDRTTNGWVTVGTTTSASQPSPNLVRPQLFPWVLNGTPVGAAGPAALWPPGGLLTVRALSSAGEPVTTIASDTAECLAENDRDLRSCGTIAGVAHVVSPSPTPADRSPPPAYLGKKIGKCGGPDCAFKNAEAETTRYYDSFTAPADLAEFRRRYGFGQAGSNEVAATYYNAGDLGIGRGMHCKTWCPSALCDPRGVACYVSNHGIDAAGKAVFGGAVEPALTDAIADQHAFATVAMVYDPSVTETVQFMVFDREVGGRSALAKKAELDRAKVTDAVPQNCLACHGGTYDSLRTPRVTGAHFLPFDELAMKFPATGEFSAEQQRPKLAQLNDLIVQAPPTVAILDFIKGTNRVGPHYVPTGWRQSPSAKRLYKEVFAPYCRSCHLALDNAALDWLSSSDVFAPSIPFRIAKAVCEDQTMPQAELTARHFWESPARATLIDAFSGEGADELFAKCACSPHLGQPCGSCGGKIKCDGTCDPPVCCVPGQGQPCGRCGGTLQCDGSCSRAEPPNLGAVCNDCGGTVQCDGACSSSCAPNRGQPCGHCGGTFGSDGVTCSVPDPPGWGAACNTCGGTTQCDGSCSPASANTGKRCGNCGGRVLCDGTCSEALGKVCRCGSLTGWLCPGEVCSCL